MCERENVFEKEYVMRESECERDKCIKESKCVCVRKRESECDGEQA